MALEISYWTGRAKNGTQAYGKRISSETRSLSGTSAQSGATPSGCKIVRIEATEAARVAYGSNPTADATSLYMAANAVIDREAEVGWLIAGKTA